MKFGWPNHALQCDVHAFGAAAPELERWGSKENIA